MRMAELSLNARERFESGATISTTEAALDLIWGAKNIARAICQSERQTFYMLESGQLPGARKVGGKWVITRAMLRRIFEGATNAPAAS